MVIIISRNRSKNRIHFRRKSLKNFAATVLVALVLDASKSPSDTISILAR